MDVGLRRHAGMGSVGMVGSNRIGSHIGKPGLPQGTHIKRKGITGGIIAEVGNLFMFFMTVSYGESVNL